jgi:hypothetical protein
VTPVVSITPASTVTPTTSPVLGRFFWTVSLGPLSNSGWTFTMRGAERRAARTVRSFRKVIDEMTSGPVHLVTKENP